MVTLSDAVGIGGRDKFLAVVSTARSDGTIQSSVVNAGLLADPESGQDVVGFVTYGKAKLANLRARPQVTITFRAGWQWAAIEGTARIIGPDNPAPGVDAEQLRLLRRIRPRYGARAARGRPRDADQGVQQPVTPRVGIARSLSLRTSAPDRRPSGVPSRRAGVRRRAPLGTP
jgi:PPOX class probable F420-dependent enzyme